MDERSLGKRLQLARRRAGLTQQELCQRAGLSYSTLAKIERGAIRTPSVFTVAAIAAATQTAMEELVGLKNHTQSPAPDPKKTAKTGVKFVYFDINGTLVRFFHRVFTEIAQELGVTTDAVEIILWRFNDAVCKGSMSLEEFNGQFAKELGLKDFDWQAHYLANVEPTPGIDELLRWVARYYQVGIISDTMPGAIEELMQRKMLPDVHYTAVVDSSRVGSIKTEPKIFRVAQELASLEPHEILLVDDTRHNLVTADKAGWHVLLFDSYSPAESIKRVKQSLEF